ncbi:MAG: argininosuccinate synthase [Deltaproteobacteria bacterium]|jgi:argininosuccinate synthase|nr:argininosuccinate synthase [Deltaproteobacteria bacterium]MDA8307815.1 argininosuccinate synthase [Deltaproteobacteria bacterium]
MSIKKVVLAYSGGLDTSIILKWLIETYGCEVVAFSADLGQNEELDGIEAKALSTGAVKARIEDLREEFAGEFVFPAFRANAIYEGQYLLGTSIARPLIAKHQIRIADEEGADAVSHGATGKGNDQVRFELSYMALRPDIKVIAPWREWDMKSRSDLIAFAKKHGIPVPVTKAKPYSSDRNMLHISYEGGILEDPWMEPDPGMFVMTTNPEDAPDKPEIIEIDYERGNPVAVNAERMSPAALLQHLNKIGGKHGVGRVDLVENRLVGMKSRGVYETPGGTIMRIAHQAVESITMDREVMHLRDSLVAEYSRMIYNGFWYSPEMSYLQKMMDLAQETVYGTARLKLYKGGCQVIGRKSERSLYQPNFATFEEDDVYRQDEANGFIRLLGLRLRIEALVKKGFKGE